MKGKILKTILVSMIIVLLTALDFVLLGYNIVIAVSNSAIAATNVENVEFDAYFNQDGSRIYEKTGDTDLEDTIVLHIEVKNNGELSDAKIQMNNANFKILKDRVQNTYVKEINDETNEITLNSITYGNSIDIELPIQFKKQEIFNSNYFIQENIINFSGTYKKEEQQTVTSQKTLKINWTTNADTVLSQNIAKFIDVGEDGVLLQQNITSEVQGNKLPREQEILNINVPVILEQKPNDVYVILNGKRLEQEKVNYNKENNLLEVKIANEGETCNWGEAQNNYQIIYIYPKEIGETNKQIDINTTLKTKLFTKDEIQKQDMQNLQVSKVGNIVDIQKNILTQSMYKGYLYAKTQNEITFEEEENINISYSKAAQNIELQTLENLFVNDQNQEFAAGSSVNYKGFIINKQYMIDFLGEQGSITIQDENGTVITTINSSIEADENGNITITYDGNKKNVKVIISKPLLEGVLEFRHIKSLSGESNYTKEELKTFTKLVSRSEVIMAMQEGIGESAINLQDTKTDAKLEINNNNLSTLQTNEDVQFLVTLNSNNEQYDLYKNPTIQIILPKELSVQVKNITQLNAKDELTIVNPELIQNDDGTKIISIPLQGEQLNFENNINEGIQISITANIMIDKTIPSMSSQIIMNYTNENRMGETFSYQLPITLNSKYGVLLVNKLSGYNENGDVIENIDDKVKQINLDVNQEAKTVNQNIVVVNNYENDITDISFIGKLPDSGEEIINNEKLKATFGMELLNNIQSTGKLAKIYYSEDVNAEQNSDTWVENVDDLSSIKAFKIEVEDNKLEPGAVLNVSTQLSIPENLEYNESTYIPLEVSYDYLGSRMTNYSNILLTTESVNEQVEENTEEIIGDLSAQISAKTGGEILKEGQKVYEGQAIKYTVTLTNNSNEDINNVDIIATQTNSIFYDEIVYNDGWDSITGEQGIEYTRIEENPDLTQKDINIETIKAGETVKVSYQFSVKEVEGDSNTTSGTIKIMPEGKEEKEITTLNNPIKAGKIKLQMRSKLEEEYDVLTNREFPFFLDITNISDSSQRNIRLELPVPEGFEFETDSLFEADDYQFIKYEDRTVIFEIPNIEVDQTISIRLGFQVNSMDASIKSKDYSFTYRGILNEEIYVSNELDRTIYNAESNITARQYGSIKGDTVKDGDELTYTCEIENNGGKDKEISITDYVPIGAVVQSAFARVYDISNNSEELIKEEEILITDEGEDETEQNLNVISYSLNLQENQKVVLIVNTIIDADQIFESEITNEIVINALLQEVSCNEVTYKVEGKEEINPDPEATYNISGTAWVDENKNGLRESAERRLNNISVLLIEEATGEVATDTNGNSITTVTDDYGEYQFNDIKQGEYTVVFIYDTAMYRVTEYQKPGVGENTNSDVISKTISLNGTEQQVAITGTLGLSNSDLENIDAGFIEGEQFDFRLDKYISKVIVQDNSGTTVTNYNNAKMAKIDLNAKRLINSTVIIEYQIKITNEGEVGGYINEVVDNIPQDLNFTSEMNKNWYQSTDGKLYSKELANQIINPSETKTLTLTLTKTMNQNNTGTVINTAELNNVSNNYSLQDIDSTPGNNVQGEDDMSTAELIISIGTGSPVMYTALIIAIILIIGIGIYFINKKVLKAEE